MFNQGFIAVLLCCWATAAQGTPAAVLVDHFDDGVQNELGGYRSTFASEPSSATAMRGNDVFRGKHGRSVRIAADRQASGFCGYWIHLFDMRAERKQYFDARPYAFLSFWVRGAQGGEDFLIKLADEEWIGKQDAVEVASIKDLLPAGITTTWQEVIVPLSGLRNLDLRSLGGITFEFTRPGSQVVYIDDIAFKAEATTATPRGSSLATDESSGNLRQLSRKLWVWSTEKLLRDAAERQELWKLCQAHQIGELWVQLLYSVAPREPDDVVSQVSIQEPAKWRSFLREAHARGLQVHALDGYPDFALQENHHIPLGVVEALIAFNQKSTGEERFDGIHLDNEPYLIVGWQVPARRTEILHDYLQLNAACQQRIREASDMRFGVDIPFWWQDRDEVTGRIVGEVEFRGKRQAASFHCLDLLDNVGVMNYRDQADGADGMIAHGRELLEYADAHGRAIVYMGIEVFRYQPTPVWFVLGLPRDKFQEVIELAGRDLAQLSRLNGLRLRTFDDGKRISLGIELTAAPALAERQRAQRALLAIAKHFGTPENDPVADSSLQHLQGVIDQDGEWTNLRPLPLRDATTSQTYSSFVLDSIMLSKLTFADNSPEELETQMRMAEEYFSRYTSYGGTALHDFDAFQRKMREREVGNP